MWLLFIGNAMLSFGFIFTMNIINILPFCLSGNYRGKMTNLHLRKIKILLLYLALKTHSHHSTVFLKNFLL